MLDTPAYTITEAARYLKLAPATLRSWFMGRSYPKRDGPGYFEPLIQFADKDQRLLSFTNLVEAYVLRALRQNHNVSISALRNALDYAEQELKISRLLMKHDLLTATGDLFLQYYGELINLSQSGQLAMRKVLEAYLARVEWNIELPSRIYPYVTGIDNQKVIVIDPCISFGRPILIHKGISTAVIVDRIDAGESVDMLAEDYDLKPDEIEMAIVYERAA
ncbi:MAG: DUF433 domain-containing protein [Candidatus Contendobacter sp.]